MMLFDICRSLSEDGTMTVATIRFVRYYDCQKHTFYEVHSLSHFYVLHGEGSEECTMVTAKHTSYSRL